MGLRRAETVMVSEHAAAGGPARAPRSVALFTLATASVTFTNLATALAKGFRAVGVNEVYLVQLRPRARDMASDPTVPQGVTRFQLKASHSSGAPLALARFLRHIQPDLLIAMPSTPSIAAILAWAVSGRSCKLVVSEHALMSYESWVENRRSPKARVLPYLARWLYPKASGIHAVSQGVLTDLVERVGVRSDPRTMRVIPNAVDIERVRELSHDDPRHPWLSRDRQSAVGVAVGRLVPQKNYPLLLDATERIARRRPFRLIVLGRGPERDRLLRETQRRGLAVDFRGYEANPYAYMARADVFLVASHEEGFGLGLVEAMACGIPAISTATSGSREILCGGAGIIVTPDPGDIADAVLKVIGDDALRASLKEKGLERAAEFTPQRVAERWLAFAADLR